MSNLYIELKTAGCQIESHESDLYVLNTPKAVMIITKPAHKVHAQNIKPFISEIDGKQWLEIPFAYSPFWEAKEEFIDDFYRNNPA